jgi:Zn-dependent protease
MDSGEFSLHPSVPPLPSSGPPVVDRGPAENPFGEPTRRRAPAQGLRKRIGSAFAAIAAVIAKFFAAIKGGLLLLPKLKLLTTAGTAVVSVAAYSLFFGWPLAAGFVVLLFVHEMGHVLALRREGIKASAPMFIPFLGAVVAMKEMPDDALAEARVGLAGPILGSLGAGIVAVIGSILGSPLLLALAYIAFFINLINLLPVVPLDGGRAMAAMAPWLWFVGFGALVALELLQPNPILLLIIVFGGLETYKRWKLRKSGSLEQAAYYRVTPRHRLLVGVVYIGLIVAIVLGMDASFVHYASGHDFRNYF